ncbi:MFS transporter [Georgenia sp. Z1344]|uniref:MFS transporter n=1 Tax=Georgenia sp. Z1344 TaxID=3416706 RepID=UPI003CF47998
MQAENDPNRSPDTPDPARWRILVVTLGAIFMALISVSIVNVALPSMQEGLGASQSDLQWVLSGYALTFGVVLVAAGRAGDVMGRGGIFLVGMAIFTVFSITSSLAPNAEWLNVSRFAQGVGSGLVNPQGVGMIQQYFRGAERARAFGYFGAAVGVSVAIGPVLGGVLISAGGTDLGWRLTFLVNVPVGLVTIALGLRWFPRPLIRSLRRADPATRAERSLDPVGALLLGAAVLAILFPFMEGRGSAALWLLVPAGVLLVVAWVWWEKRYARSGRSPMVDLAIFRTRSFTNGSLMITLYFLGMTSVWVLVALYMQQGDGRSAMEAGVIGLPSAVLSAFGANWAGKRVLTYGRKLVIGGLLMGLVGLVLSIVVVQLHASAGLSVWWLLLSLSFIGAAQGCVVSPNQTLTLAEVPLAYAGSSGAVMQTGQRIGTSIGIAVITAAVFGTLEATDWPTAASLGFGVIAVVLLAALAVAVKDLRDRREDGTAMV